MTDKEKTITAKQCKAARAFLGWSQNDLASKARVAQKTITDFERGVTNPQRRIVEDIKVIFESEGIEFSFGDEGQGVVFNEKNLTSN